MERKWNTVSLSVQQVQEALDGRTTEEAYARLLPSVRAAASAEFNRNQLEGAPLDAKKRWVARLDEKTRETHRELNGQTVPIGSVFRSGTTPLFYPGDTSAPIELWANCRCTMVIVL